MSTAFGQSVVQPATQEQSGVVFFLHGLGDSEHVQGLLSTGPSLKLPHVKFIYPWAPEIPITLFGGASRYAWFDMANPDLMGVRDEPSVSSSVAYLRRLVAAEVAAGIPESRIVVGGFSQGGYVALRAACQLTTPLAGVIGLSAWCEAPSQAVPEAAQQVPIFIGHGADDDKVPVTLSTRTADGLCKFGLRNVDMRQYEGLGHATGPQELADVRAFLLRILPDTPSTSKDV